MERSAFLIASFAAAPLAYLRGYGEKADAVVGLTWGVLLISIAVIVIITLLVAGAIWRRPGQASPAPGTKLPLEPPKEALAWLWIGVGISSLVLLASVVWTMVALANSMAPATKPALTIEVTGHQWWWQIRYLDKDPSRQFTTADEIHIPTGVPVRFRLIGADVIHSFWVPALGGKTDMIPGQTNITWLEAAAPGTYRGQCSEYCGPEHAHMAFFVIAQKPADFRRWWNRQLQPPAKGATPGRRSFDIHCGACHAVRGTEAAGTLGPDLSHFASRKTIAAGMMANTPANLLRWISDPQAIKPGALMQAAELSPHEKARIVAYLGTLK